LIRLSPERSIDAAFDHLNIPYVYIPFHVTSAGLPIATAAIRHLSLVGVNITVPHKERVMQYLDRPDETAQLCRAVNTVVYRDNILTGYNTDGSGFIDSLRLDHSLDPHGIKAVILGAGGSARAIMSHLLTAGAAQITILNRTVSWAQALAGNNKNVTVLPLDGSLPAGTDLVVNTLSVPFRQEGGSWLADLSPAAGALFYDRSCL
jgi:shikimate dehydrogenase